MTNYQYLQTFVRKLYHELSPGTPLISDMFFRNEVFAPLWSSILIEKWDEGGDRLKIEKWYSRHPLIIKRLMDLSSRSLLSLFPANRHLTLMMMKSALIKEMMIVWRFSRDCSRCSPSPYSLSYPKTIVFPPLSCSPARVDKLRDENLKIWKLFTPFPWKRQKVKRGRKNICFGKNNA